MGETVIKINNLGKRYKIGKKERYQTLRDKLSSLFNPTDKETKDSGFIWALKDITFDVYKGEVIGIIGRNGAGKTTFLKILSRITKPTEGSAEIMGRVGSLLEVGTGFHPELTGRENIFLNGAILGMAKKEIQSKFDEIVAFAEVEQFIDTPVKYFSTGMSTRLAFSVAAHFEPDILFVDEVLAVGDLKFQKKCLNRMGDVAKAGRTILFVSHQMNQIRRLCSKVIWIEEGQIRKAGSTAEVATAYETAMSSNSWQKESAAGSNKMARFVRWDIADSEQEGKNIVTKFGPVTIRFELIVNKEIKRGHHGITLYDNEGKIMWGWAVDDLKLSEGAHTLTYSFPTMPLKPGGYNWHLSLYEEGDLIDEWFCTPEIIIDTESYQHPVERWNGVLNLPCKFTVDKLSI